jgi:hypothetical protein
MRNSDNILLGKPEGKDSFARLRRIWYDNIKMHLRETEWGVMDWIHLFQDRNQWQALVNTVTNLRVPRKADNFVTS